MELQIQKLLRGGMSADELLEEHGVHLKAEYNGKHSLVYDQLKAKDTNPVAQECRGLILEKGSWNIVAFPFKRFFNYGQEAAADINWETAEILEKLDGTLIIAYWDKRQNKWCVATRAMCEAQGTGNFDFTFYQLVENTCGEMGFGSLQKLMAPAPKNHTLMFELTAPENRVICEYKERRLSLIGARNIETHQEILPKELAHELKVPLPKTWKFNNINTVIESISTWDPKDFEGVVVRDDSFARIKIKSPKYLLLHHATDSLGSSWRAVAEAVASGHADDLDGMMPLFVQTRLDIVKEKLRILSDELNKDWLELSHIKDQKEFALLAQKKACPSGLFALKNKKVQNIEEFFKNVNPNHLVRMCGLKEES